MSSLFIECKKGEIDMFENKSYELYKGDCLEVMDELIEQGGES